MSPGNWLTSPSQMTNTLPRPWPISRRQFATSHIRWQPPLLPSDKRPHAQGPPSPPCPRPSPLYERKGKGTNTPNTDARSG